MALLKPKWLFDLSTFKPSINRKRVLVKTFEIFDIDDPELALAEPVSKWQQTEQGKFVMANSEPPPSYHEEFSHDGFKFKYHLVAYFDEKTHIYWKLKYE